MNAIPAWFEQAIKRPDAAAAREARERQGVLTKPPGSLGELEALAIRLAGLQGRARPRVDRVQISVFAADHGIAAEGVSAFPQAVTAEMVKNFARGGAAISVLARALGATLEVVDLGTAFDAGDWSQVRRCHLGPGTANFARGAAMSQAQCAAAMEAGRGSVEKAVSENAELFIGGDMGIANTTSATALACALLGIDPEQLAGPGTGLNAAGVAHKVQVIRAALALHAARPSGAWETLRYFGGFEIAALCGAFVACACLGLPALVDGFIATAAALVAERLRPGCSEWLLFAHRSGEPGHKHMLQALQARPLLDLGMRLGEGSGAAVALPLLRLACELHGGMATFSEAGVPEKLS
jgi:nicotinate-nucleotide--dimethylbenzimidazole phosphoribosyltransferase